MTRRSTSLKPLTPWWKPTGGYFEVAFLCLMLVGLLKAIIAQGGDLDPRIVKLVAAVSEDRLGATLKKLGSFETRSTPSSTTSTT